MSLILEALKKSEARRRLGEAPDLDTPFAAQRRRRSPLPFIAAAIVIAAGAGWWLLRTPTTNKPSATAAQVQGKQMTAPAPAPAMKTPAEKPPTSTRPSPPAAPAATPEQAPISAWVAVGQGQLHPMGARNRKAMANAAARPVESARVATPATNAAGVSAPTIGLNAAAVATPAPGVKKPEPPPETAPVAGVKKPELPAAATLVAGMKKPEPPPEAAPVSGVKKPELPPAAGNAHNAANTNNVAAPAPTAAAGPGAQSYYELPFSVRKDMPAINLSMHVFAPEPLQRFIILNGSRMAEGDSQDDLAIREIRPDGVVFEFHGQRLFYPRDGM